MSEAEWSIRPLTSSDAPARRALRLEALREFPAAYGSIYEVEAEWPIEKFAELPPENDGRFAGAFAGEEMIGMAVIMRSSARKGGHWAHIYSMYVRPAYWGSGVAEAIVEHLMEFARGRFEYVELSAMEGNSRAKRFYERLGFREYGRRPASMRNGDEYLDEYLLWRAVAPRA
jgi:ribosomal protein S18 acetylase RimI-like enzyme